MVTPPVFSFLLQSVDDKLINLFFFHGAPGLNLKYYLGNSGAIKGTSELIRNEGGISSHIFTKPY